MTRIAIVSLNNPAIYPALLHLGKALATAGAEVHFLSSFAPTDPEPMEGFTWVQIPQFEGLITHLPLLRANYHGIFSLLRRIRPTWVVGQHEYLVPALVYKAAGNKVQIAGYFSDYHRGRWYTGLLKHAAPLIDVYIDVCDLRTTWRRADWPRMKAPAFVIRQAPPRRDAKYVPHVGPTRLVFTGSRYVLGLDQGRLSQFLTRLCEHGISVDWFLPGREEERARARSLATSPHFAVRDPIEKAGLLDTLATYDAGLHWAPLAEQAHDATYFLSAASNKVGEYIAAGLIVSHAGNPGLSYLPRSVSVAFDPTDALSGADQLAALLADREVVEGMRASASRYHLEQMNFEIQSAELIAHLTGRKLG